MRFVVFFNPGIEPLEQRCLLAGNGFNVDELGHVSLADFPGNNTSANDLSGFVSPSSREYAIIGLQNGTGFVEVTDPQNPTVVAFLAGPEVAAADTSAATATQSQTESLCHDDCEGASNWRDIKIFDQYAYVTNETGGGLQIVDLTAIDSGVVSEVGTLTQNSLEEAHNIAINPDSGFAFLTGANIANGGLVAVDLATDPANPQIVGTWAEHYLHDAEVISYTTGPFAGREIVYGFAEEEGVKVIDVTDKANMFTVTTQTYPNVTYSHYGALSEDLQYLFVNDELDERDDPDVSTTTTYVMDVSDPANPTYVTSFTNGLPAIDHNLRVRGNFLFEANYRSGLRVFDVSDVNNVQEVGYYDTYPADDGTAFDGAWGVYTDLPSGVVLVSDTESGLFVLDASKATDSTGPVVVGVVRNGGGQNFDELVTAELTFSEDVFASLDKFDLVLVNDSTQAPVDLTPIAEPTWDGGTNTAMWTFSGAAIDPGFHTLTLVAAGITDAAGNPLDGNGDGTSGDDFVATEVDGNPLLVAIPGDADLDGVVTNAVPNPPGPPLPGDAVIVIANLNDGLGLGGRAQGEKLWIDGDFNGDGLVTIAVPNPPGPPLPFDYSILIANLGMSVVVPAPDSAMTFAVSDVSSEPLITTAEDVSGPLGAARVHTLERAAVFDVDPNPTVRRPTRRASAGEVDTAIIDLSDERFDEADYRRKHDRLADDRHTDGLDSAWDRGLMATLEGDIRKDL